MKKLILIICLCIGLMGCKAPSNASRLSAVEKEFPTGTVYSLFSDQQGISGTQFIVRQDGKVYFVEYTSVRGMIQKNLIYEEKVSGK